MFKGLCQGLDPKPHIVCVRLSALEGLLTKRAQGLQEFRVRA